MSLYSQFKISNVQSVSVSPGGGLSVSTSTGNIVLTNTGVLALSGGTDITVSTATGNIIVSDSSTLETVTSRGSSSTYVITLTTATLSTSTNSGALIVTGGVGIGGNINIGGSLSVGNYAYVEPQLIIHSSTLDTLNSATIVIDSSTPVGYSEFTIKNSGLAGSSFTLGVGGNNHALTGGTSINEGNFTIYDDVSSAYRFVILKNGNVLLGGTTDTGQTLQVNGDISATTGTFTGSISATTGTFTGAISATTATFTGLVNFANVVLTGSISATTATFSGPLIVQQSLIETVVKPLNTSAMTEVDSFVAANYRSCKMFIQIQDDVEFVITEIVLLHDDMGQVYKSEYGIINTGGGNIGEFSADLQGDGIVRLYFTANVSSSKTIKIIKTAIAA